MHLIAINNEAMSKVEGDLQGRSGFPRAFVNVPKSLWKNKIVLRNIKEKKIKRLSIGAVPPHMLIFPLRS